MYRFPLFLLAVAMFLGSSLIANLYGLVQPAVREELGLSSTLAGAVFSVYSLSVAVGSWGAGRLAGRIAAPTLLRTGLIASLLGHAAMLVNGQPVGMFAGFALIGFGQGQAMATVSALVSARFDGRRSQALSILEVAFSVGAIATPALAAALGGWRAPYTATAILLVVLIAASLVPGVLPGGTRRADEPADRGAPRGAQATRIRFGFAVCLLASGIEWTGSVWLPSFVTVDPAFSAADAAFAMTVLWSGFLVSRVCGALLFARVDVGRALIAAAALATLGATLTVSADTRVALLAGAALLGLGTGCLFPGVLGQLVDLDPDRAAAVTGTAIAMTALAGVVLPLALGAVADLLGLGGASLMLPAMALATLIALVFGERGARRVPSPG